MKKLFLTLLSFIFISFSFLSCGNDNYNPDPDPVNPPDIFIGTTGMYILNEGNYYNGISGSLSFLNFRNNILGDSIFMKYNGKTLGGSPNDILVYENELLFVPVTEDNIVWVINAKSAMAIQKLSIPSPRKAVYAEDAVYVTSYTGKVFRIDLEDYYATESEVLFSVTESEVLGACLEDITYCNGYLYVCNAYNADYTYNTNVIKLTPDMKKVKDITVTCNPTLIESDGANVYVCSYGNYYDVSSSVQKINGNDDVTAIGEGTFMCLSHNDLYIIDANNKNYYKYDTSTGEKSTFITGKEIDYPAFIAVDDYNQQIYIGAFHFAEGTQWGDYNSPGYMVKYSQDGVYMETYNIGISPKCAAFIYSY